MHISALIKSLKNGFIDLNKELYFSRQIEVR